jgi:hypothetical protein
MIRFPENHQCETCRTVENVCEKYNMSLPESCLVEGRTVINFADTQCLTYPDLDKCDAL